MFFVDCRLAGAASSSNGVEKKKPLSLPNLIGRNLKYAFVTIPQLMNE